MALELCGWLLPLLQQAQVIIAFNKNSCPFVFTWQTKWNCACLMRVGHSSHSYFFAGWRNHSHNLLFTTTTTTSVLWLFKRVFIVRTQKNNLRVPRTSFPSLFFLVTYAPAFLFSTFPIFSLLALSSTLLGPGYFFSRKSKTDAMRLASINEAFFLISHLGK